jgi:hypothetical protein
MGIVLLVTLYVLRIAIRSRQLASMGQNLEKRIREASRVPGSEDIPTRVVASYLWKHLTRFSQTLLIAVPVLSLVLGLIIGLSSSPVFQGLGSAVTILGCIFAVLFVVIGRPVIALSTGMFSTWLLCILGITTGRRIPLDPGGATAACIAVTTVYILALACLPQSQVLHPWRKARHIISVLWILVVPLVYLVHFRQVKRHEAWVLPVAYPPFFILFALVPGQWHWLVQLLLDLIAMFCVTVVIPTGMIWLYWPLHGSATCLLWIQLLCSLGSGLVLSTVVWFYLRKFYQTRGIENVIRLLKTFMSLIIFVGVPGVMLWAGLPTFNKALSDHANYTINLAGGFLAIAFVFITDRELRNYPIYCCIYVESEDFSYEGFFVILGWYLFGFGLATFFAWVPCMVWLTDWSLFNGLRSKKIYKIHAIWVSGITWLLAWQILLFLWLMVSVWFMATIRKRKPSEREPSEENPRRNEESAD